MERKLANSTRISFERDRDTAVYVISVAADLAGVHPQTLRTYERKGLLDPARTSGGSRRYSEADLERLRRIGDLTEEGVNLEGVRRIIDLEAELDDLRAELERRERRPLTRSPAPTASTGATSSPTGRRWSPVGRCNNP